MAELESQVGSVRVLSVPLQGTQLLLPNALVVEVVGYVEPQNTGKASWYVGDMSWRGHLLPVVFLDNLLGQAIVDVSSRGRIVVIASLSGGSKLPFFGMYCHSIPRLLQADHNSVTAVSSEAVVSSIVLCQAQVQGAPAFIPNLELIEQMIVHA